MKKCFGYKDANSREMDEQTPHNVIDLMEEQKTVTQMGGTMRLGAYDCEILKGSRTWQAYGEETLIKERHRHRYEFNNTFISDFENKGLSICGKSPDDNLVETVELSSEDFYIGLQYHPEFKSRPNRPHPLFLGFIGATLNK